MKGFNVIKLSPFSWIHKHGDFRLLCRIQMHNLLASDNMTIYHQAL